jgi:hypothetical protein
LERRRAACEIFAFPRRRTDKAPCSPERAKPDHISENRKNAFQPLPTLDNSRMPSANTAAFPLKSTLQAATPKARTDDKLPKTPVQLLSSEPQRKEENAPIQDDVVANAKPAPPAATTALDIDGGEVTAAMLSAMSSTFDALLRGMALFRGLTPESAAQLFTRVRMVDCETGALIYQRGEANRCVYVVLSGAVETCDASGTPEIVLAGEIFGETALLNRPTSDSSARATEPSCLLKLALADVTQELPAETVLRLMLNITVTLSRRLKSAQPALQR